ncbi:hypothetical protein IAR55_004955 [Kwoniella newhampshirensis]|uniref:SAP domain-containing protein n=1 Tax=Kwoniella newhampshirensis TaxID=1651941 RepID=A0AAW0YWZ8_9TREE
MASSTEQAPSKPSSSSSSSVKQTSPSPKVSKKQTVDQLRDGLAQLGLETKGKKETLWRRLLNAAHRAALRNPRSDDDDDDEEEVEEEGGVTGPIKNIIKQPYRSFLCFDVEATCRPGKEFDYPNEIIEFPVVLLRWSEPDQDGKKRLEKIDSFRSYVRPTWRPNLTDFCTSLTGITQNTVDSSPTFPQMLKKLEKWLDKWDLRSDKGYLKDALWVTDGPWDLRDFVPKQLHITPPSPFPNYFHGPYLNVKQAVQTVLSEIYRRQAYASQHPTNPPNKLALSAISTERSKSLPRDKERKIREAGPHYYFNIPGMCHALGLGDFEGRQHSGLDDATNIARILIALSEKDVVIESNGRIPKAGQGRKYAWMGEKGEVKWEEWMSSNKSLDDPTKGKVKNPNGEEGKSDNVQAETSKIDLVENENVGGDDRKEEKKEDQTRSGRSSEKDEIGENSLGEGEREDVVIEQKPHRLSVEVDIAQE